MVQYRARCKRRNVVSYRVPEETKRLVLAGRWKTGVCVACFDELAEQAQAMGSRNAVAGLGFLALALYLFGIEPPTPALAWPGAGRTVVNSAVR